MPSVGLSFKYIPDDRKYYNKLFAHGARNTPRWYNIWRMLKGVIFAIIACLVWGLVFVVPSFMQEFSSVEVSMGRYFTYGILSLILN